MWLIYILLLGFMQIENVTELFLKSSRFNKIREIKMFSWKQIKQPNRLPSQFSSLQTGGGRTAVGQFQNFFHQEDNAILEMPYQFFTAESGHTKR